MPAFPKQRPVRLNEEASRELRQHVLARDGWRCQACGAMRNLEVHHQQFRSQSGEDTKDNLITLCAGCHTQIHTRNERD
jgi:5-methylcytosine-specific restriction endonuclease McrA